MKASFNFPQFIFITCPALAATVWLILGILLPLLTRGNSLTALAVAASLLLASLLFAVAGGREGRRWSWFLPLGLLVSMLHLWAPWQTYRRYLPRPECGAEIEAVVCDPYCIPPATPFPADGTVSEENRPETSFRGDATPWSALPKTIHLAMKRLRLTPSTPWITCRGHVLLKVRTPAPDLTYGSTIRAEGGFILPDQTLFPGDFDYRQYLRAIGIRHLFQTQQVMVLAPVHGWRRLPAALYNLREKAVAALVRNITLPQDAQILTAVVFGSGQALDPGIRNLFLRSGTIHIFSVSGLQVAILASIFYLVLKLFRLPYQWRYDLLPLLLGLYVVMTGAAPAAIRAWVMITLWTMARGRLLPTSGLNTIAVAAIVLLLANPLNVLLTGFQFSFILVFFLILGWHPLLAAVNVLTEKDRWVPFRCQHWPIMVSLRHRLASALLGGLLGWTASVGLIAWTNQLLIPSALLVNFGISLLAWLALLCSCLKLSLAFLPWGGLDHLLGGGFDLILGATRKLAEAGSLSPGSCAIPRPGWFVVVLFYGMLVWLLLPGISRRWRLAAAAFLLLLLGLLLAPPLKAHPQLAIFGGDGSHSPAVVMLSRTLPPLVLNPGGFRQARHLASWLRVQGISEIELLVLPRGDRDERTGMKILLEALPVRTLLLPAAAIAGTTDLLSALPAEMRPRIRVFAEAPPAAVPTVTPATGKKRGSVPSTPAQAVFTHGTVTVQKTSAGTVIRLRSASAETLAEVELTDLTQGTSLLTGRTGDGRRLFRIMPLGFQSRIVGISD